jgi:hypothetical protein
MTKGTEVDRVIVTIDLRDIDPATVLGRPFYEFQAERGPQRTDGQVDFSRVILVDRAGQLLDHSDIYAHVLDSHIDVSMICVAIGPPPAADPTVAIRRPLQLGPPKAAIVWVGDLDGIGWRMDSTLASQVNMPPNGSTPDPARLPQELLDAISLPQVFDEVITLVTAMPGNVASPGVRTVYGDIPADILSVAQRAAIKQLTKKPGSTDMAGLGNWKRDLGYGPPDVIRPGGRLDDLARQSVRTGNGAINQVRGVTDIGGFARSHPGVRPALRVFADAIEAQRGAAAWALDEVDTSLGFDSRQRQDLSDVGIDLTEPPAAAVENITTILTEQSLDSIGKCQSLPAIASRLLDEAEEAGPRGTRQYQASLRDAVSDGFLRTLRTPPAFISGVPPAPVLATAFATCLVSGTWPQPGGLYGAISAIASILIGLWMLSRGAELSPATRRGAAAFLASFGGAAVVGAGCGVALSRVVTARPVAGLGAVVTVAMLALLTLISWRVLTRRWVRDAQVARIASAPNSIRKVMVNATQNEWRFVAACTAISNHAKALADLIEGVTTTLADHDAKLAGLGAKGSPGDQESQELVSIDLAAGTASALDRLVAAHGAGGLAAVDGRLVRREVTEMLDEYRVHLLTASLHEAPPFARVGERRAELAQALVERGSGLQSAVRYVVADERINQLCAPHQLTLLETRPDRAELVRFAPHAAQGLIDQRSAGHERPVRWTWASALAGVLRLVPLRPGAVEDVISKAPAPSGGTSP